MYVCVINSDCSKIIHQCINYYVCILTFQHTIQRDCVNFQSGNLVTDDRRDFDYGLVWPTVFRVWFMDFPTATTSTLRIFRESVATESCGGVSLTTNQKVFLFCSFSSLLFRKLRCGSKTLSSRCMGARCVKTNIKKRFGQNTFFMYWNMYSTSLIWIYMNIISVAYFISYSFLLTFNGWFWGGIDTFFEV